MSAAQRSHRPSPQGPHLVLQGSVCAGKDHGSGGLPGIGDPGLGAVQDPRVPLCSGSGGGGSRVAAIPCRTHRFRIQGFCSQRALPPVSRGPSLAPARAQRPSDLASKESGFWLPRGSSWATPVPRALRNESKRAGSARAGHLHAEGTPEPGIPPGSAELTAHSLANPRRPELSPHRPNRRPVPSCLLPSSCLCPSGSPAPTRVCHSNSAQGDGANHHPTVIPGSLSAKQPILSPPVKGVIHCCFCSLEPNFRIGPK